LARRWKVLIVTSVAVFMALLDVTIVNIAFPDMQRSFHGESLSGLSWILNAYNIVFAAVLIPAGRLADRIGRRRLFLAGTAVFLVASLACSLAPAVWFLVLARTVQAIGAAVVLPTSLSLILPEFSLERRATATSLWTAAGAVAAAAGPALGGIIVHAAGWRWIFLINLVIGVPTLVVSARLLRESRDEASDRWPDVLGAVLLAGGVTTLALALTEGENWGWASPAVVGLLVAAIALSSGLVWQTARSATPIVDPGLFRIRSFTVANVGSLVFGTGFNAMLLCNVLFLTSNWGYTVLSAGAAMTVGPVTATLTAPMAGRLADRFGQRVVAVPGGLLLGLAALMLATLTGHRADYPGVFLPATLIAGVGLGLALPSFGSAAVAELPRARFATGVAASSCARQIGAVVGVAALVAVLHMGPGGGQSLADFHWGYRIIALAGLLTAITAAALGRVRARDVESIEAPTQPAVVPPRMVETAG
jgi:NTE family protein